MIRPLRRYYSGFLDLRQGMEGRAGVPGARYILTDSFLTDVSRIVRLLLLVGGLGIVARLVLCAGPALLLDMLARVGWSVPAVAAVYTLHQLVRAAALWRSVPAGSVRYAAVLRIRLSGEAVEMLTFTRPFLAEPAKGWLLSIAFFFVPGQLGLSEGVYALLLPAIGCPAAAGLTIALVRRVRGLLVAGAGVVALA